MPFSRFSRLTWSVIVLFLSASAAAQNLSVQKPDSLASEDALRVTRDQVQNDLKPLVAKAMNFTDDEAAVFWPIYDKYKAELSKLSDRSVTLVAGFAAHYRDLTDPQAIDMTRQSFAIEQDRLNLREKYFDSSAACCPASVSRVSFRSNAGSMLSSR